MELSKGEREQLEAQQATFASRLETNPEDTEAMEGAAVTAVNLGDYAKGEKMLTQLTAIRSNDPEAWRLLAETRTALGQMGGAAEAYRSAFAASPDDIVLLKGLAGSLVADGKQSAAVDEIKAVGERLRQRSSEPAQKPAVEEGLLPGNVEVMPAEEPGAAASTEAPARLTAVEVDLLLAKVYAQWKGHVGDAFAVYDKVIEKYPEDFR
jgi:tetratricopeptide (TPR) repeat protein